MSKCKQRCESGIIASRNGTRLNKGSYVHTCINWAKNKLSRRLTRTEMLGALLIVSSLIVGLFAVGLRSSTLGLLAGASFLNGDVLFLIGGARDV